ncbi:uncharacterized protein LOC131000033 [Salvia miltiorrhiza]|uniref:uncharacterized protein LOC131000033 n=1 Tax=Salvia miltiorrhiza TaxID=226208 RepID=UPI0025AB87F6|nr:uncharacterized protein LOC131000033 [Salvia miltiorrhiza]
MMRKFLNGKKGTSHFDRTKIVKREQYYNYEWQSDRGVRAHIERIYGLCNKLKEMGDLISHYAATKHMMDCMPNDLKPLCQAVFDQTIEEGPCFEVRVDYDMFVTRLLDRWEVLVNGRVEVSDEEREGERMEMSQRKRKKRVRVNRIEDSSDDDL